MSKTVLVCDGTLNATTITSDLQASCVGTWQFYPLEMFMPTTQLTREQVETMFVAAVSVFLLAKTFQMIRRQFFN